MEINKPVNNPKVVEALEAFIKEQNPRTELDMIEAVAGGTYMIPVVFDQPVVDGKLPEGAQISHCTIKGPEDKAFFPLFTDEETMLKWSEGRKFDYILLDMNKCTGMVRMAKKDGVNGMVINPAIHNIMMTAEMLDNIQNRFQQLLKMVPPRFRVGIPKDEPTELTDFLKKYLKKSQKTVNEAWILLSYKEGVMEPGYMLVVDCEQEGKDCQEMFTEIIEACQDHLKKGEELNVAKRDGNFAEKVLEKAESFYVRKTGLFW